jgi:hypothetical protein
MNEYNIQVENEEVDNKEEIKTLSKLETIFAINIISLGVIGLSFSIISLIFSDSLNDCVEIIRLNRLLFVYGWIQFILCFTFIFMSLDRNRNTTNELIAKIRVVIFLDKIVIFMIHFVFIVLLFLLRINLECYFKNTTFVYITLSYIFVSFIKTVIEFKCLKIIC